MPDVEFHDDGSGVAIWTSAAGRLVVGHCRTCAAVFHYPRALCPYCHSVDTDLREAAGTGTILSYTVSRPIPAAEPHIVAFVTLDEGPALLTNLVDTDVDRVGIGLRVEAVFRPQDDDGAPRFRACSP